MSFKIKNTKKFLDKFALDMDSPKIRSLYVSLSYLGEEKIKSENDILFSILDPYTVESILKDLDDKNKKDFLNGMVENLLKDGYSLSISTLINTSDKAYYVSYENLKLIHKKIDSLLDVGDWMSAAALTRVQQLAVYKCANRPKEPNVIGEKDKEDLVKNSIENVERILKESGSVKKSSLIKKILGRNPKEQVNFNNDVLIERRQEILQYLFSSYLEVDNLKLMGANTSNSNDSLREGSVWNLKYAKYVDENLGNFLSLIKTKENLMLFQYIYTVVHNKEIQGIFNIKEYAVSIQELFKKYDFPPFAENIVRAKELYALNTENTFEFKLKDEINSIKYFLNIKDNNIKFLDSVVEKIEMETGIKTSHEITLKDGRISSVYGIGDMQIKLTFNPVFEKIEANFDMETISTNKKGELKNYIQEKFVNLLNGIVLNNEDQIKETLTSIYNKKQEFLMKKEVRLKV